MVVQYLQMILITAAVLFYSFSFYHLVFFVICFVCCLIHLFFLFEKAVDTQNSIQKPHAN
jgi:hypothetical protein